MINRLSNYPEIKESYLEYLISRSTKIPEVFVELTLIYFDNFNFEKMRQFTSAHPDQVPHVEILEKIKKLPENSRNYDVIVLEAETLCRIGKIESGLKLLIGNYTFILMSQKL